MGRRDPSGPTATSSPTAGRIFQFRGLQAFQQRVELARERNNGGPSEPTPDGSPILAAEAAAKPAANALQLLVSPTRFHGDFGDDVRR